MESLSSKPLILLMLFLLTSCQSPEEDTEELSKSAVPTIDLSDYQNPEKWEIAVKKARNAIKEIGFFVIVNPGVDQAILQNAYSASEAFFRLEIDEKISSFIPSTYYCEGYIRDADSESIHIGPFTNEGTGSRWSEHAELSEPMAALYNALEEQIAPLYHAVNKTAGNTEELAINVACWRRGPTRQEIIWAAPQIGVTLFTPLPESALNNLELKDLKGDWIRVSIPTNGFLLKGSEIS